MKSLVQHIYERRHVNNSVIILADYIFNKIKKLSEEPAEYPSFNNESRLHELWKDNDEEFDMEIWFKDVKGFDWWETQLLTYGILEDPEFDCDMVVRLERMEKNTFGTMDRGEPLLSINAIHLRTINSVKKHASMLRNTIVHELTHYVQYMGNTLKGGTRQQQSPAYDKVFYDELNKLNIDRYRAMSIIIYSFNKNESNARVSGMYGTLLEEFNTMLRKFRRANRNGTREEFIDFVVNNEKYNENELHIQYFGEFLQALKDDTYEKYMACVNDPKTIFRDDSMIYVFLNFCDHCDPKPLELLPSRKTCVFNTRTEEDYNRVKNKIVSMFEKNLNKYIKRIREVVGDFYDELDS